jgi:hypothetical protein
MKIFWHFIVQISEANRLFEKEPNIVEMKIPVDGRLTVVGDLHGQIADLLTIFRMNGILIKE